MYRGCHCPTSRSAPPKSVWAAKQRAQKNRGMWERFTQKRNLMRLQRWPTNDFDNDERYRAASPGCGVGQGLAQRGRGICEIWATGWPSMTRNHDTSSLPNTEKCRMWSRRCTILAPTKMGDENTGGNPSNWPGMIPTICLGCIET